MQARCAYRSVQQQVRAARIDCISVTVVSCHVRNTLSECVTMGRVPCNQVTLTASLKTCKDELEKQTNNQIRENRRAMDRRARKAFEDEHKGTSKLAGKRAEHRTQKELRWRVPHGLQWVERHEDSQDEMWAARLAQLQRTCPGIRIHHTSGEACVGVIQVGKQTEEEIRRRIENAGKRWLHQAVRWCSCNAYPWGI